MDFDTQRQAVAAINRFSEKHRLLSPACAAARAAAVGFCSAVRFFDMALSDKEGNFLGIKRERREKTRSFYIPDEKAIRPAPGNIRFGKRLISAAAAFSFMLMVLPPELAVISGAAEAVLAVSDGVLSGAGNSGVLTYKNAAAITAKALSKKDVSEISEGAFRGVSGIYSVDTVSAGLSDVRTDAFASCASLTEIYISAADGISIGKGAFDNAAPDSAVFVSGCSSKTEFDEFAQTLADKYSADRTRILDDRNRVFSLNIPADVKKVRARTAGSSILVSFRPVDEADGYGVYLYSELKGEYVKLGDYENSVLYELGGEKGICVSPQLLGEYRGEKAMIAVRAYKETASYDSVTKIYSSRFALSDEKAAAAESIDPAAPELTLSVSGSDVYASWDRLTARLSGNTIDEADYYKLYIGEDYDSCEYAGKYDSAHIRLPLEKPVADEDGYVVVLRAFFDPFGFAEKDNTFFGEGQIYDPDRPWVDYYEVSASTGGALLGDPTDLRCDFSSADDYAVLSWSEVSGADGYLLSVKNGGDSFESSDIGNKTSYRILKSQINEDELEFSVCAYISDEKTGKYLGIGREVSYKAGIVSAYAASANDDDGSDEDMDFISASLSLAGSSAFLNTPYDVSASAGDSQVTITWTEVENAQSYEVYRFEPSAGKFRVVGAVTKNSFTDTGLENGTMYTYVVVACMMEENTENNTYSAVRSGQSLEVSAVPKAAETTVTTTVTSAPVSSVTTSASTTAPAVTTAAPAVTTAAPASAAGASTTTTTAAPVPETAAPGAPVDFTAVPGEGQATLSWTEVKDAAGYQACIINSQGIIVPLEEVSKTSAVHVGLTNGNTYTYVVRAFVFDDAGNRVYGPYSIQKSVTIGAQLSAPIDVEAVAGDGEAAVSWSEVNGADGYVVYAYDSSEASFKAVSVVSKPTFVHSGLVNGRVYTYMIVAYKNTDGHDVYSDYSIAVSVVPGGDSSGGSRISGYNMFVVGTTPYGLSDTEVINASSDTLAFNTDVDVRFGADLESEHSVKSVLSNYAQGLESFDIYPFDISLYVSGTYDVVEPEEGHYVTITMPVPDRMKRYGDNMQLVHITSDDKLEIIPITFGSSDGDVVTAQFKVASFSPFAFVHYYTAEDLHSGSGTGASASAENSSSAYALKWDPVSMGYKFRRRNKVYKIIRRS